MVAVDGLCWVSVEAFTCRPRSGMESSMASSWPEGSSRTSRLGLCGGQWTRLERRLRPQCGLCALQVAPGPRSSTSSSIGLRCAPVRSSPVRREAILISYDDSWWINKHRFAELTTVVGFEWTTEEVRTTGTVAATTGEATTDEATTGEAIRTCLFGLASTATQTTSIRQAIEMKLFMVGLVVGLLSILLLRRFSGTELDEIQISNDSNRIPDRLGK